MADSGGSSTVAASSSTHQAASLVDADPLLQFDVAVVLFFGLFWSMALGGLTEFKCFNTAGIMRNLRDRWHELRDPKVKQDKGVILAIGTVAVGILSAVKNRHLSPLQNLWVFFTLALPGLIGVGLFLWPIKPIRRYVIAMTFSNLIPLILLLSLYSGGAEILKHQTGIVSMITAAVGSLSVFYIPRLLRALLACGWGPHFYDDTSEGIDSTEYRTLSNGQEGLVVVSRPRSSELARTREAVGVSEGDRAWMHLLPAIGYLVLFPAMALLGDQVL